MVERLDLAWEATADMVATGGLPVALPGEAVAGVGRSRDIRGMVAMAAVARGA